MARDIKLLDSCISKHHSRPSSNMAHQQQGKPYFLAASSIHGTGSFAAKNIPVGTPIIRCEDVWTPTTDELADDRKLATSFYRLDRKLQDRLLALNESSAANQNASGGRAVLDDLYAQAKSLDNKEAAKDWLLRAISSHLKSIIKRNNLTGDSDTQYLYIDMGHTNHCCVPNAQLVQDEDSHMATLYAVRDIPSGREIFVDYTDSNSTYERRQELLRFLHGISCGCPLCSCGAAQRAASDARRTQLSQNMETLTAFAEEDERLEISSATRDALSRQSDDYKQRAKNALRTAEKAVGLANEEGLVGMDMYQIWNAAWRPALVSGEKKTLQNCLDRAKEEADKFGGMKAAERILFARLRTEVEEGR